jgi:hypothetical protein
VSCCKGSVSWECCYPDTCSCCAGCVSCSCCNGSNCQNGCASSSTCGKGGCCTCNSGSWGFAWKQSPNCACSWCMSCGSTPWFSANCSTWLQAARVDTHNAGSGTMADLTKSLFMQFAPLSQGIISNMRVVSSAGLCC